MDSQTTVSWVRGKCIGKGSFGTVTIGMGRNDRVFAVKSVDNTAGGESHRILALENEIRILRSLSSPYIVEFIGDDVTVESPGTSRRNLHMEYLPGGTIAEVAARGEIDEKIFRSFVYCLVSALRYVHSKGIVHCDVKGKNVLVRFNCSTGVAKLADFGSAVEIAGGSDCSSPMPRGSPLWMAPEVVRRESQGPMSDVWSLGCTVIEMITGKPAWRDDGIETLKRIGYSPDLPEFPNELSEIGHDFLDKCLQRDPNLRWSCDQLLQHPFISTAAPKTVLESSPRCVLDWMSSEFDEGDELSNSNYSSEKSVNLFTKQRIGDLVSSRCENWESDGWLTVRSCESDTDDVSGAGTEVALDTKLPENLDSNLDTKELKTEQLWWGQRGCQSNSGFSRLCNLYLLCIIFEIFRYSLMISSKECHMRKLEVRIGK